MSPTPRPKRDRDAEIEHVEALINQRFDGVFGIGTEDRQLADTHYRHVAQVLMANQIDCAHIPEVLRALADVLECKHYMRRPTPKDKAQ